MNEELLKVLRKTCKEREGQFRGSIKTLHFLLNLSSTMFFIPSGLDIFSTFVLTLLKDNNPFSADRTLVSIAIDIGDSATYMGTQFKTIGEVSASDIHRRIEEAEMNSPNIFLALYFEDSNTKLILERKSEQTNTKVMIV